MRYFTSYSDVFKNRDQVKRETFRLQSYDALIKFLTRKPIEGNLITDEFSILKKYFESKDFTNVYFLSPYILNENQLSKDLIQMIISSGETNNFNKIFNIIKDEVNTIKGGSNFVTSRQVKVKTADEYLDLYYSNPKLINQLELTDKSEEEVLIKVLQEGLKDKKEEHSVLYFTIAVMKAKTTDELTKAINLGNGILVSFPYNVGLLLSLGDALRLPLCNIPNKGNIRLHLYLKAAELNDPKAIYLVGLCYFIGDGVNKNTALALEYWKKAAQMNNEDAISGMGVYYLSLGQKEEAKKWLIKSAAQGEYKAMLLLDTDFDRT